MGIIINFPTFIASIGIDTSDATVTSSDILLNKTAYINGEKITDTIENLESTEYTPSNIEQMIESEKYLSGNQIIKEVII